MKGNLILVFPDKKIESTNKLVFKYQNLSLPNNGMITHYFSLKAKIKPSYIAVYFTGKYSNIARTKFFKPDDIFTYNLTNRKGTFGSPSDSLESDLRNFINKNQL